MLLPQSYDDVRDKCEKTILQHDPHDIVKALTMDSSIGPIIPPSHCESLELLQAFHQVQTQPIDYDLLEQIHITISEYFNILIDYYNLVFQNIDRDDYFIKTDFDTHYVDAEKKYMLMFGVMSPRILFLRNSKDIVGKKMFFHEIDGLKYTFCPLNNMEIKMKNCKGCPLFTARKQDNPLKSLNLYYCNYESMLDENDNEEEF